MAPWSPTSTAPPQGPFVSPVSLLRCQLLFFIIFLPQPLTELSRDLLSPVRLLTCFSLPLSLSASCVYFCPCFLTFFQFLVLTLIAFWCPLSRSYLPDSILAPSHKKTFFFFYLFYFFRFSFTLFFSPSSQSSPVPFCLL